MMTLAGTNTWVMQGSAGAVVIDPGPADPAHVAAIGVHGPIAAVVLTHRHLDHTAAVAQLAPRVPVFAASAALARGVDPVRDGDVIAVGEVSLRVLALPGHTSDSIGLVCEDAHGGPVIFTGDTLLGGLNSTMLVADDGGDLSDYLDSLERIAGMPGMRGLPGHGPVIADLASYAAGALAHRLDRLAELRAALAAAPERDLAELAARRYPHDVRRQAVSLRMLEVERAFLREGGR